jgi:hypothetical protein
MSTVIELPELILAEPEETVFTFPDGSKSTHVRRTGTLSFPIELSQARLERLAKMLGRVNREPVTFRNKIALAECCLFTEYSLDTLPDQKCDPPWSTVTVTFSFNEDRGFREDGIRGYVGWNRLERSLGRWSRISAIDVKRASLPPPEHLRGQLIEHRFADGDLLYPHAENIDARGFAGIWER